MELKPCPFCGEEAEMHLAECVAEYASNKNKVPKGARVIREIRRPGEREWVIEYRRKAYVPRCTDTKCAGRLTKMFKTECEAVFAWNRRLTDEHFD